MNRNTVNWPSNELLHEMALYMTGQEMEQAIGCSRAALSLRLRRAGIYRGRSRGRIQWPSDDSLRDMARTMTGEEMGVAIGCSADSVNLRLVHIGGAPQRSPGKRVFVAWPPDAELRRMYVDDCMTGTEIADALECGTFAVYYRLRKLGVAIREKTSHPTAIVGSRLLEKDGYELEYQPDHPFATGKGYVRVHRLVMEKKLGRYLTKSEVVHHRDEDAGNNSPDNLELFPSNGEHLRVTRKGRKSNWTARGRAGQLGHRILGLLDDESARHLPSEAIQLMRRVLASLPEQTPCAPG